MKFSSVSQSGQPLSPAVAELNRTPLADPASTRAATSGEIEGLLKAAQGQQCASQPRVDLGKLLSQAGYSHVVSGVNLAAGHSLNLAKLQLEGLQFKDCTFDGSHLNDAHIKGCSWDNCRFIDTAFTHAQLDNTHFSHCHFQQPTFLATRLNKVGFLACPHIHEASFEDSTLHDCAFAGSHLSASHFLNAQVRNCKMSEGSLRDVHFFDQRAGFALDATTARSEQQTRPAAATLFNPHTRGVSIPRVGKKISEQAEATPIRVALQSSQVSQAQMNAEVEDFLAKAQADPAHAKDKLAEQLIGVAKEHPERYPGIKAVVEKAQLLARHVNAVVLPGGEDVPPALYGAHPAAATHWGGDYRRSVLELALIHECLHKGLPLVAICRGFQMMSVYHGASLLQHIGDSERGVRQLPRQDEPASGLFANTLSGLRTAVYHHQAVPVDPASMRYLEPSSVRNGWVMAAESIHLGAPPAFGVQFHPEFFNAKEAVRDPVSDEALERLTGANTRSKDAGLQDPGELVSSGIVNYMSANNDRVIGILQQVANTHWNKRKAVEPQALAERKAQLRPRDSGQRMG